MGLEFKGDNNIVFWACPQLENRGWLGRAMVLQGRIQDVWIGGFKLAEGVRFVQSDQFFLKFPMKMK